MLLAAVDALTGGKIGAPMEPLARRSPSLAIVLGKSNISPSETAPPSATHLAGMPKEHHHVQLSLLDYSETMWSIAYAIAGWWFQPIWKILVKLEIFPK